MYASNTTVTNLTSIIPEILFAYSSGFATYINTTDLQLNNISINATVSNGSFAAIVDTIT